MQYGKSIIDNWYLDKNITFLNNGSFGATPKAVIEESNQIIKKIEEEPVRFFLDDYPQLMQAARKQLAAFLNADSEGLALIENATSGVNTVIRSLAPGFKKGDKILISNHVYPAVKFTLDYIETVSEAEVVCIDIPFPVNSKEEIIDKVQEALVPEIKLAVFDHVTSATGIVLPIEEICNITKSRGITTIIDGAHAPGMLGLDISALNADFYIGNCHKWLFAMKGCAFLWTSAKFRDKVHPLTISNHYNENYINEFDWVGTRNPSSWLSLPKALDFYDKFGNEKIREYNHELLIEAAGLLNEKLNIKIAGAC